MLELKNISKSFPLRIEPALDSINLQIEAGQFCIIIGSNGSGKSTLLKTISGELRQDRGTISLAGMNISKVPLYKRSRIISSVEQDISKGTIGEMTLLDNMVLSAMRGRAPTTKMSSDYSMKMYQIIKDLGMGLEKYLYAPISRLSGGQRQIIATLMANMSGAKLLLLDEHTSALDPKSSVQLMRYSAGKIVESKITTLMITHDLNDAIEYGDRLIIMSHGKIIEDIGYAEKIALTKDSLMRKFQTIDEGIY